MLEAELAALERARAADRTALVQEVVSGERRDARLASARFPRGWAVKSLTGRRPVPPAHEGTTFWSSFYLSIKAPAHENGYKMAAFYKTPYSWVFFSSGPHRGLLMLP